ncbi:anti-sigma-D factor RsdA [Mycolicibacterium llatzerense]|uniref:anti-sigma-D factor RsdA n=1 Tax=Mycolicibacterium llatzerense TaxID=280871 RepID=UPI000B287F6B|nr:anti-sigma-D factor RsdA [Mycolicibacterium llatzerense]
MPDSGQWSPGGGDPSLNEIRRVDRFFDALAADEHAYSTDSTEAELAFLLADWRDGIREPAVTTPVTARDAVAALQKGLHRKESRTSLTIVGSVAAALLCLGGFGTAIYTAGPNSSLFGLHTAMFGAPRVSDEQVMLAAQTEMQQVQQLIDNGQWQQAQDKLQALSPTVQSVDAPEHKQQLIQQWNALTYKVVEQNPAATLPPPGEPQPVLPSSPLTLLPVPVVEPTSSSSATSITSTTTSSSTTATSTDTSSTSTSASTSPSETTTTSSSTSATSPTETSSSASSTASSSPTATSTPSSSASTATSAPSTVPPTATATATQSATLPSTEPVVTNPPTASATVAPSPTQSPAPAQTVTTVAPTVTVPSVTTPAPTNPPVQATVAPTTKEAQQEPTRERSVVTTTQAPSGSGSGHGQH